MFRYGGCFGVVYFLLSIYVTYLILAKPGEPGRRLLWLLVVWLLPLIGAILYLLLENKPPEQRT